LLKSNAVEEIFLKDILMPFLISSISTKTLVLSKEYFNALFIRFSNEISYKFSFCLINKFFNCDKKLPEGNHGYYILKGIKENE